MTGHLLIIVKETSTSCYAWALLSNHVHLLLRTGTDTISTVMKRLLTGYAVTYNRWHKRHGQLFQNRYKSTLCQEDPISGNAWACDFTNIQQYLNNLQSPIDPSKIGKCYDGSEKIACQLSEDDSCALLIDYTNSGTLARESNVIDKLHSSQFSGYGLKTPSHSKIFQLSVFNNKKPSYKSRRIRNKPKSCCQFKTKSIDQNFTQDEQAEFPLLAISRQFC